MNRTEFPAKIRVAAYQRSGGHCEECSAHLGPGGYHYDHVIPCGLGGEATLDNCAVLCRACHGAKTSAEDIPTIARAKRVHAKHIGAKRPKGTIPGSKASGWKRKMDGTVIRRDIE